MKKSFADILSGIEGRTERRTEKKLPLWAAVSSGRKASGLEPLEIPSTLALEQCSSEETADFKRRLLLRLFPDGVERLCDLSCGLGIDSFAFSKMARKVVSFERAAELADAARRNFLRLGADNIEVRCEATGPGSDIPESDVIFADPSRRDSAGRKLFRLQDCSPEILPMLPMLLEKAGTVLLKLSPMADISLIAEELGESLREVHILSLRSEVKELLCLLERGHSGGYGITATEIGSDGAEASFSFTSGEERQAEADCSRSPEKGELLLEPRAALMKSGAYRLICSRFAVSKLAPSTHLYLSTEKNPEAFRGLFKTFEIVETLPFGAKEAKALRRLYPDSEVSARNLPLSSEELRRRTGVGGGGPHHIFGCDTASGRLLIVGKTL